MAVVAIMFFIWEKFRLALLIIFITLLAALGLDVSQKDWDLGKLLKTGSFKQSELKRDTQGNILYDKFGNLTTDKSKGKKADEYNCSDFATQKEAQAFF